MSSEIISGSKCVRCGKVAFDSDLKDNPEGLGKICIDTSKCNEKKESLNNSRDGQS